MVFNNFFLVNGIYFPQSFRQCPNFHNKGPEMLKRCKFAFFASYPGTSSTCQLFLNVSWSRSFSYLVETPESYTMFDIYNASNQTVGLMTNFECPRMSGGHAKCRVEHWQSPSNALAECSGKHSNAESFEFGLHCDILYITGYHRISQVSVVTSCN